MYLLMYDNICKDFFESQHQEYLFQAKQILFHHYVTIIYLPVFILINTKEALSVSMSTNLTEKVERYNEIGQVVRVTLRWRGKIFYLQMFFPGSKFPSRGEVETQVKKIYPDAVIMIHYASETQPNKPLIRVTEGKLKYGNYGNYIDGQKSVIGNYRFGEKHGQWTYNYKDGVVALSGNYRNGVPNGSWFWIRANKSEMVNIDSPDTEWVTKRIKEWEGIYN